METDLNQLTRDSNRISTLAEGFLAKRRATRGRPKPSLREEGDLRAAYSEGYVTGYEEGLKYARKLYCIDRPIGMKGTLDG